MELKDTARGVLASVSPPPGYRSGMGVGALILRVLIGTDGSVEQTEVVQGVEAWFDNAAVTALRAARFPVPRSDGKPIKVWVSLH